MHVTLNISADAPSKSSKRFEFLNVINPHCSEFIILMSGVFFMYIIYGYIQELLFSDPQFKQYGWFLTWLQFGCYALIGLLECLIKGFFERKGPLKHYFVLSFLTVSSIGFSNTSLEYLNYPTQVIFKSCKLVPVMIVSMVLLRKKYQKLDLISLLLICVGLSWFTLSDSQVQPNFNFNGVILIFLALCSDALLGNLQEKILKESGCCNREMVFYSYSIGFGYIFFIVLLEQRLSLALAYSFQRPFHIYGLIFLFSLSGYLGVSLVLLIIKKFGALTAVTVTTCRKAVTIVLSFLLFTKPFTVYYVYSGVVLLSGITLNIYSKNRTSIDYLIKYTIFKTHRGNVESV